MKKSLIAILLPCIISCTQKKEENYEKIPVDRNASRETVGLYNRLFNLMEKGIMVGHQDDLAYGHSWYKEADRSDVKDITGDYPAVIGWELGHVELGEPYNLDSVYFSDMKDYIRQTHRRNGITTLSWHGDNIVTGGTSWDCAQDSIVRVILPGGSHHENYMVWLDRVADFFLDLKDDNGNPIPVVFRMYHEHTGDWFWWGRVQCTPAEYKQLWKMTVEHLRDKRHVHNLLYAYSPATVKDKNEFFERYPGDEYVDIIGYDCYVYGTGTQSITDYTTNMDINLTVITDYARTSGKLPIIGETGMESIPHSGYFTEVVYPIISKYKISWILFWRNAWESDKPHHFYLPYEGHPAANDFKNFTEKADILMNSDIH